MNIYKLFTPQLLTITVTGTTGTANVTIDGIDYLATFNTSLAQTAIDFVASHAAAILTDSGFVVTNPTGAELLFTSTDNRISVIAIANATGDLAGTPSAAQAAVAGVNITTSGIAEGGNISIMQMESADGVFEDDFANKGDYEVLQRLVKHEIDLITYATDNSLSLSRTANDGSGVTVLV